MKEACDPNDNNDGCATVKDTVEDTADSVGEKAKNELGMGVDAVPKFCDMRGLHCNRSSSTSREFNLTPILDAYGVCAVALHRAITELRCA
jgi:hypothetical protein